MNKSDEEKNFISKDEFQEFKQSVEKQLSEKDTKIAEKDKVINVLEQRFEEIDERERQTLIKQVCDLSGESPDVYKNTTKLTLEQLKSTLSKMPKPAPAPEADVEQGGILSTIQPKIVPTQVDEYEQKVQFFGDLFNFNWAKRDANPARNRAARLITQSEFGLLPTEGDE